MDLQVCPRTNLEQVYVLESLYLNKYQCIQLSFDVEIDKFFHVFSDYMTAKARCFTMNIHTWNEIKLEAIFYFNVWDTTKFYSNVILRSFWGLWDLFWGLWGPFLRFMRYLEILFEIVARFCWCHFTVLLWSYWGGTVSLWICVHHDST